MSNSTDLLNRNSTYAEHHNPELTPMPKHNVIVVSCLDARTDPAHFLGLEPGDALVLRTVGGRVTEEVIDQVAFVSTLVDTMFGDDAPAIEVVVCHHTKCGAGMLADPGFSQVYADRIGSSAAAVAAHAVTDPAATAATDVDRLRASPKLAGVSVAGYVLNLDSGLLESLRVS